MKFWGILLLFKIIFKIKGGCEVVFWVSGYTFLPWLFLSMKRGYGGILEYIEKCKGFVGMLFYGDNKFKKLRVKKWARFA